MAGVPPDYVMPDYRMTVRFAFGLQEHCARGSRRSGQTIKTPLCFRHAVYRKVRDAYVMVLYCKRWRDSDQALGKLKSNYSDKPKIGK